MLLSGGTQETTLLNHYFTIHYEGNPINYLYPKKLHYFRPQRLFEVFSIHLITKPNPFVE